MESAPGRSVEGGVDRVPDEGVAEVEPAGFDGRDDDEMVAELGHGLRDEVDGRDSDGREDVDVEGAAVDSGRPSDPLGAGRPPGEPAPDGIGEAVWDVRHVDRVDPLPDRADDDAEELLDVEGDAVASGIDGHDDVLGDRELGPEERERRLECRSSWTSIRVSSV